MDLLWFPNDIWSVFVQSIKKLVGSPWHLFLKKFSLNILFNLNVGRLSLEHSKLEKWFLVLAFLHLNLKFWLILPPTLMHIVWYIDTYVVWYNLKNNKTKWGRFCTFFLLNGLCIFLVGLLWFWALFHPFLLPKCFFKRQDISNCKPTFFFPWLNLTIG